MVLATLNCSAQLQLGTNNGDTDVESDPQCPGPESPDIPDKENCTNCSLTGAMLGAMSVRIQDLEGVVVNYQNKMDLLLWWIGQKFGEDVQLSQILNLMNNNHNQCLSGSIGLGGIIVPEPDFTDSVCEDPTNYLQVDYAHNNADDYDVTDTLSETINQVAAGNFDDRGITDMDIDMEMDFVEDTFEFEHTRVPPALTQLPLPLVSGEPQPQPGASKQFKGYTGHNCSIGCGSDNAISPRAIKENKTCRLCKQVFQTKDELNKHKLSHLSVTLLRLPTSVTSTSVPINFNNQIIQTYMRNTQVLQLKQMDGKKDVKFLDTTPNNGKFKCLNCTTTFSTFQSLQFHTNKSKRCTFNPNKVSCSLCARKFINNMGFRLHVKRVHTDNVRLDLSSSKV